jgi:hypothetical protein
MSRPETPASRSPVSPPDDESAGISRAYRRVLIIWVAVLAGLWWLQHAFI